MADNDENFNNGKAKTLDNDAFENVTTIMLYFMEQAMKTSGVYVKHCERKSITVEDIKRALMLEMFLFKKRDKKIEDLEKIKKEIFGKESAGEEEEDIYEDIIDEDEDEEEEFTESDCNCKTCACLNDIYDKWETFVPQTNIEKIMKNHIDNIENSSLF